MDNATAFGLGFGAGAALLGFCWAKSTTIYRTILLDKAEDGSTERLADGRFYRIVWEGEWNGLKQRLHVIERRCAVAIQEAQIMHRRENETLSRLAGGGFTAAPTAAPDAAHRETPTAALDQLDGRARAAEDVTGGFDQPNGPAAWRGLNRRGGLIEG